ncbi:MAG: hypothetical protein C4319_05320 [Acidimicrobiia bacterium]
MNDSEPDASEETRGRGTRTQGHRSQSSPQNDGSVRPKISETLMKEVKSRLDVRRRAGLYGDEDDALPFAEAALEDDLAAAANRLAAAARIPSIVPDLRLPAPHDEPLDMGTSTELEVRASEVSESAPQIGSTQPPASRVLLGAAFSAGRKVFRAIAGDRIDRFIDGSAEFFFAAADFAREASERILALERRVRELEESLSSLLSDTSTIVREAKKLGSDSSVESPPSRGKATSKAVGKTKNKESSTKRSSPARRKTKE